MKIFSLRINARSPAEIRTPTKRTKIFCATITPPGSALNLSSLYMPPFPSRILISKMVFSSYIFYWLTITGIKILNFNAFTPMRFFSFTLCIAYFCAAFLVPHVYADPPAGKSWRLVFFDDFNAENSDLDARWDFQNGPNSHILCSRWRENATVENGVLKLMNRKESRGGQEWTSASMWTKQKFLYGYFEARYKYSAATGTNNSFWLITTGSIPEGKSRYEIDINEGHYPSEINTNLHNWSDTFVKPDGSTGHVGSNKAFEMSESDNFAPWASFECVNGVLTSKIRFLRGPYRYFHLREIRIFGSSASGYQDPKIADYSSKFPALFRCSREQ